MPELILCDITLKYELVVISVTVFINMKHLLRIFTLTNLITELSPFGEAAKCSAIRKIPSDFKELEGSSPCSQQPSTIPYPEPVRSSP
jgi:hypothetical protein